MCVSPAPCGPDLCQLEKLQPDESRNCCSGGGYGGHDAAGDSSDFKLIYTGQRVGLVADVDVDVDIDVDLDIWPGLDI